MKKRFKTTLLLLSTGILLTLGTISAFCVEINSPLAPMQRPQRAPLPNSNYNAPEMNQNYAPHEENPAGPTFKLNTGPDINHQQSCMSRYKSYRSSDDTYVDHGGVRQTCQSSFPK